MYVRFTFQTSAKKKAERKYEKALRDAGIDEDFLVRKSRGAPASGRSSSRNSVSYGDDDFEKSDSIASGLNSVRSERSGGSAKRNVYSDDESISSIHTEED